MAYPVRGNQGGLQRGWGVWSSPPLGLTALGGGRGVGSLLCCGAGGAVSSRSCGQC